MGFIISYPFKCIFNHFKNKYLFNPTNLFAIYNDLNNNLKDYDYMDWKIL